MIKYPAQLDDSLSLPLVVDNNTPIQADVVNRLRNAIIALETELGVKPSGIYSTVRARLDYLESTFGSFDFIRLDQDLGGSVTLPKVIGIQGRPVSSATPNTSDVLAWNGIAWAPTTSGSSTISFNNDLSGSSTSQTVIGIQNRPIDGYAPNIGQALVWNGSKWIPGTNSLTFSNITALKEYDTTNLIEGTLAFVNTLNAFFEFSNNFEDASLSMDDPENFTVLESVNINSPVDTRWFRKISSDIRFCYQNEWHIDSINGNNENTGLDSSNMLKTFAEVSTRLGDQLLLQDTYIFIYNDLTEAININPMWTMGTLLNPTGNKIIFRGIPKSESTYSLTGRTTTSRSVNRTPKITKGVAWNILEESRLFKISDGIDDGYGLTLTSYGGTTSMTTNFPTFYVDRKLRLESGYPFASWTTLSSDNVDILILPIVIFSPIIANNVNIQLINFDTNTLYISGGNVNINRCLGQTIICNNGGQTTINNCLFITITGDNGALIDANNCSIQVIDMRNTSKFIQTPVDEINLGENYADLFFNTDSRSGNIYDNEVSISNSTINLHNICLYNADYMNASYHFIRLNTGTKVYLDGTNNIWADSNSNLTAYFANVNGFGSTIEFNNDIPVATIYAKFNGSGGLSTYQVRFNSAIYDLSTDIPITNLIRFNGIITGDSQ